MLCRRAIVEKRVEKHLFLISNLSQTDIYFYKNAISMNY